MNIQRIETGPRLSEAVIHQNTVYLAGQVADDGCGPDIYTQTRQTLASIDRLLALCGSDKSRVLSATIWLTNMDTLCRDEPCLARVGCPRSHPGPCHCPQRAPGQPRVWRGNQGDCGAAMKVVAGS